MLSEQEVFTEALTIVEAGARTEYLDRVCGPDKVKRQRLSDLLKLHESVDSVLDRSPQQMIESLSDGTDVADSVQQSAMTLAALQPFLEPSFLADSKGRLNHYELLEVLGQGGYGIVFKALDTKLDRLVAIKILGPHLAATSPPRRRFLREARAAAAVRHENVVQIYAVEESPIPYLVMEFVSGETLQQRSDRLGPFPAEEVVRLGLQIVRGLAAAHAQGLVHRDIKPCNILVEDGIEPIAKLTDFGLARTADDASRSMSGIIIGTPMYMSPEQVAGGEVDQRTDLFSFGSVLYLMLSGRPPFRATSTLAVLKRVAENNARSIRDIISDASPGLCAVISRLHAKVREGRFSTAKEVEHALAICLTAPASRWQTQSSQFWATWPGRLAGAAVLLLVTGALGLMIGESTGTTHFFARRSNADVTNTNSLAAAGGAPSDNSANQTKSEQTVTANKIEEPTVDKAVKQTEPPVVKPAEEEVPLTEWEQAVGRQSADGQIAMITARLKELNPELDESSLKFLQEDGVVLHARIERANQLVDASPLRALRQLKRLWIRGDGLNKWNDLSHLKGLKLEFLDITGYPIRDLSPLKGMPLTSLGFWPFLGDDLSPLRGMQLYNCNFGGGHILRDLEPLRGMRLELACFNHTLVEDLSPLKGMPLRRIEIQNTRVSDISPLTNAPLEFLGAMGTQIKDFSPLKGSTLKQLRLDYVAGRDEEVLRAIPGLDLVNDRSVADFLANP